MEVSIGLLVFSIVGITGLFSLKRWEENNGRVFAPSLRQKADAQALELKEFLNKLQMEIEEMPSVSVKFARIAVHDLALGFAGLANFLERQAHNLADLVSHKHRFERREPRNEFLKRVGESKSRNGF